VPESTACEPLSINGIQEVSGSIPLISTKKKQSPKGGCFFLIWTTSCTADLLHFNQNPPPAGFPAFTAGKVSGSIPLISTNEKDRLCACLFSLPGKRWRNR